MASPKQFVFIEPLDAGVVALLTSLRAILSDTKPSTPIHITLRGPYKTKAIWDFLDHFGRETQHDPILISGVGQFKTPSGAVVFLKAKSEVIDRLLFKPDFPKSRFGSNPHITIYEGSNLKKADAVFDFLKGEGMYFLCKQYRFTPHLTRQFTLPFEQQVAAQEESFKELLELGKVRPGILARALKVADRMS